MRAHGIARELGLNPPTMEQPQYNMLHRERVEVEYLPLYREIGLGTTIWSPLASGLLTGKYKNGIPPGSRATLEGYGWLRENLITSENIAKVSQLEPIAEELGCGLAQVGLAWCLKNPHVSTVMTGASKPEQVIENMKAIDVVDKLDSGVMERIDEVLGNNPESDQS